MQLNPKAERRLLHVVDKLQKLIIILRSLSLSLLQLKERSEIHDRQITEGTMEGIVLVPTVCGVLVVMTRQQHIAIITLNHF